MALLTDNLPAASVPARVRLEPMEFGHELVDGRWWPRSSDPVAELPGLIRALDRGRSPVIRLLLSAAGWARRPHQVEVDGRVVSLGYCAGRSPTTLAAICADGRVATVLVGPDPHGEDVWASEDGHLASSPETVIAGRPAG